MAFTFSIKDTYRQAVEAASGGKQTVLYDDKGYPSIMNIIPKLSYKDVGLSDSTKALPAFMVDDAEKPEIFVGTFMAMVHDGRVAFQDRCRKFIPTWTRLSLIVAQRVRAGIA